MKITLSSASSDFDISPGNISVLTGNILPLLTPAADALSGSGMYRMEVDCDYSVWSDSRCRDEVFALASRILLPAGKLICPAATTDLFKNRTMTGSKMEMTLPDKRNLGDWKSDILWPGFNINENQVYKERLYQHQYEGLRFWDSKNRKALWGHDMGLGKTHTGAWLCYNNVFAERYKRILVVTLASIVPKWAVLLERFAVPHIVIDKDTDTLNIPEGYVVLCSFERCRTVQAPKDMTEQEKKKWDSKPKLERITPLFFKGQFDLIMADESHRLNKKSNIIVSLLSRIITPETHLLFMSGTPFGNGFHEAWPQMNLIEPGIFIAKTQTDFYARFCENKSRNPSYPVYRVFPHEKDFLFDRIKTKTDFRKIVPGIKLPPFTVDDDLYNLTPEQVRLTKNAEKNYVLPLPENCPDWLKDICPDGLPITSHMQLLHIRRMICSGVIKLKLWAPGQPEEYDKDGYSVTYKFKTEKEGMIMDQLSCMPEHQQTIIWISYTETAVQLHNLLKKEGFNVGLIYGKTGSARKKALINDFLSGKIQHLISNPGCIGTGLDFINATIHIAYECTYSGIEYEQSRKRSHRISQTKPVTMHRYCGRNSIEKRVLKALDEKIDFLALLFGEKHSFPKSKVVMKADNANPEAVIPDIPEDESACILQDRDGKQGELQYPSN